MIPYSTCTGTGITKPTLQSTKTTRAFQLSTFNFQQHGTWGTSRTPAPIPSHRFYFFAQYKAIEVKITIKNEFLHG